MARAVEDSSVTVTLDTATDTVTLHLGERDVVFTSLSDAEAFLDAMGAQG